jgi:uncharacterized membrane protein HdeD (DUF308 family)
MVIVPPYWGVPNLYHQFACVGAGVVAIGAGVVAVGLGVVAVGAGVVAVGAVVVAVGVEGTCWAQEVSTKPSAIMKLIIAQVTLLLIFPFLLFIFVKPACVLLPFNHLYTNILCAKYYRLRDNVMSIELR